MIKKHNKTKQKIFERNRIEWPIIQTLSIHLEIFVDLVEILYHVFQISMPRQFF